MIQKVPLFSRSIKFSPSIIFTLLCACFALQGCGSVKKTLGIDRDPPNEYRVTPSEQPLEMPPNFSCLPVPMPGVERPQDKAARQAQEAKFLGSTCSPGSPSASQHALLDMCGVQPNQEQVRYEIDNEARLEDKKDKPIVEKLGIKKAKPKGEAINPYAEAERLQEMEVQNPCPVNQLIPSSEERLRETSNPQHYDPLNPTHFHGKVSIPLTNPR